MRVRLAITLAAVVGLAAASCHKRAEVPPPAAAAEAALPPTTIRVIVSGLQNQNGQVLLALFASPDGFPGKPDRAERRMQSTIEGNEIEFVLEDVPAGWYAISILHDENGNQKMETDFFGRPNEGYGFSQNARGRMGPPGFDDASFYVAGKPLVLRIEMTYR